MSRLIHSLPGVVIFCMWLVFNCSLQTAEAAAPQARAEKSGQRFITIDFDNVDIQLFIKYISELSGKNFVVDKAVQGTVTVLSPTKISEDEAYKVFESVLEVHGFTTVESGSIIKILPSARARSQNLQLLQSEKSDSPEDRVVTQLVRLKHSSPAELKKVLAPLVSQTSVLISHAPSGILLITETMSNIQKLLGIIEVLDVESREEEVAVIPLVNASADVIAKILTSVYQTGARTVKGGVVSSTNSIKIVPYDRVNALIVLTGDAELRRVRSLIKVLDTEVQRAEGNIHVYYLQNATAKDLAAVLNNLPNEPAKEGDNKGKAAAISKNVQVMADEETNALIIRATKDEYAVMEEVIKQLDIPRRMVYLEALIIEVDADRSFDVGVEWAVAGSSADGTRQFTTGFGGGDGFSLLSSGDGIPSLANSFASGVTFGILNQGVKIGSSTFADLGAVVRAFKSDSDVNVISTPQILTMDNKKAEISVGENVPFLTSQQNNSQTDNGISYNNYEYKDVATKLGITPHINQSNVLRLEIETEVVRVKGGTDTNTPTTLKRTASTTVILSDKSTVVIGGIIGHDATEGENKVPLLGDIPLLGWLFKTKSTTSRKTNMFIFITPRIVRNPANLEAVTLMKEEEMGRVLPAVQNELHKEVTLEHAMTLTRRGYEKLRAEELVSAKEYFAEALNIDPANPFALMNMGVLYEKEGQPAQAVKMYQAVVRSETNAVTDASDDQKKEGVPLTELAKENIERILRTSN